MMSPSFGIQVKISKIFMFFFLTQSVMFDFLKGRSLRTDKESPIFVITNRN